MRIIHTSDWHIGHRLYGQSRHEEHRSFLDWLLTQLIDLEIDVLLIAGDIFDTHNPSAESTRLYYNFLMRAHQALPALQMIVIGGNHDSAQRLDAPREVLKALNVHVIGGLPNPKTSAWDDLYIKVSSKNSDSEAWVAAVPFLRASDLPLKTEGPEGRVINGVREVYQLTMKRLSDRLEPHQALILTGHCEMNRGLLSLESERKPRGYGDQSLPDDIFSLSGVKPAYVALGHLHLAQEISASPPIRYSGAPLAFSIAERDYPHQIVLVELEGAQVQKIEPLPIPKYLKVEMLRIPKRDETKEKPTLMSFDEVIRELKRLPELNEDEPQWRRPLLQVNIHSEHPDPNIKVKVLNTLKTKHVRLAKISVTYPAKGAANGVGVPPKSHLNDINPEEVFKARWKSRRGVEPPPDLALLFEQLRDEARVTLAASLEDASTR